MATPGAARLRQRTIRQAGQARAPRVPRRSSCPTEGALDCRVPGTPYRHFGAGLALALCVGHGEPQACPCPDLRAPMVLVMSEQRNTLTDARERGAEVSRNLSAAHTALAFIGT